MKKSCILVLLLFLLLTSGCKPTIGQPGVLTSTLTPSVQSASSPTFTPPQATLTPTTLLPALAGTPHLAPSRVIDPGNAAQLTLLATYGNGYLNQLVWSPDGSLLAAATSRGIALFSVTNFRLVDQIPCNSMLSSLAFSLDGSLLAAGSTDSKIIVWSMDEKQEIATLQPGSQAVVSLAFSADGDTLAASSRDNTIYLINTSTWQLQSTLVGHLHPASRLKFSADSHTLFSFTPREQVRRWSLPNGMADKELYIGIDSLKNAALDGSFSGDGAYFAAAQNNQVRIFETARGTTALLLTDFPERVSVVALSLDGTHLSAVDGSRLTVWDIQGAQASLILEMTLAQNPNMLAFSPDGTLLFTGNPLLSILDLQTQTLNSLEGVQFIPGTSIHQVLMAESDLLVRNYVNGTVQTIDLSKGSLEWRLRTTQLWNVSTCSSTGKWIAGGAVDGQISLWNTDYPDAARFVFYPDRSRSPSTALLFDPDEQWLAAANAAGRVWFIDLVDGSIAYEIQPGFVVSRLAVAPSGSVMSAAGKGNIQLYVKNSTGGWVEGKTFRGYAPVFAQENMLVYRSNNQDSAAVITVNPRDGSTLFEVKVPAGDFALSADGSLLAVSGIELGLYDVANGTLILTLETKSRFAHLMFNANGSLLITIAWDGVMELWGIPP